MKHDSLTFTCFWAINDELDIHKMKKQMDEMKRVGLQGIVFQPRNYPGKPKYLGKEYMNILNEVILYAKSLGMIFWIYDEDGWPSGSAGGRTKKEYPDVKCQWLEWHDNQIVWKEENDINSLDQKGVGIFIELTHEGYKKGLSPEAFDYVEGFFSDEVGFLAGHGASVHHGGVPWCPEIEDKYRERYQRDVKKDLPKLFVEQDDYEQVRYRYWELLAECLVDSFYKPVNEWCLANGKKFTAHLKGEENIYFQVPYNGSAFRLLRNVNVPAIDALERYPSGNFFPRMASSLAKQFYDGEAFAEAIGGSGWGLTPEDFVRFFDWLTECGISTFTMHLQQYQLKAEAIRDWPPSIPLHMNWKEVLPAAIAKVNRIHEEKEAKKSKRTILLVAPCRAVRAKFDPVASMQINEHNGTRLPDTEAVAISDSFDDLVEDCMAVTTNFDVTEEQLLEEYGNVVSEGLQLGNIVYDGVIFGEGCLFVKQEIVTQIQQAGLETSLAKEACVGKEKSLQMPMTASVELSQQPWQIEKIGENQMLVEYQKETDGWLNSIIKTTNAYDNRNLKLVLSDPVGTIQINGVTLKSENGLVYDLAENWKQIARETIDGYDQYRISIQTIPDGEQRPFVFLKGDFRLKTDGMWMEKDGHQKQYKGGFVLANTDTPKDTSDFIQAGLPFMAQPIIVTKQVQIKEDVNQAMIKINDVYADAAMVSIDETELGWAFGPDWSVECPELGKGEHTVRLKLIPNTFNTYGPHHHLDGDRHLTSPMQYEGIKNFADHDCSPEYTLVEAWHFVKFGINGNVEIDKVM